jgi:2-iminobutanoate/2-iminopropanoate deaminase
MSKPEAIRTRLAPAPRGNYSQAVRVGNLVFVSGQLPLNPDGQMVVGTISDEARQALSNVKAIVEAAGGTLASVVQCTIYLSDIAYWNELDKIYNASFFGVPVLPARAVIPVKEMHYGAHIEIQAMAILGEK